jgi:hypothetical protein
MTDDAAQKVHFKVGDKEFGAEGTVETVQRALAIFLDLIGAEPNGGGASPDDSGNHDGAPVDPPSPSNPVLPDCPNGDADSATLEQMFREEADGVISLRSLPRTASAAADGLCLLLLGHLVLKNRPSVSAKILMKGAKQSGIAVRDRVSTFLGKCSQYVVAHGTTRGTAYALNNPGIDYTKNLLKETLRQNQK